MSLLFLSLSTLIAILIRTVKVVFMNDRLSVIHKHGNLHTLKNIRLFNKFITTV
ncbi:hypothetical protein C427_3922 [Paraglaciecola psychrophila 170]|uniref:Uncharacterized protein n=1 Tax=Paraglaciecola psychrophila 170 TaxID=1129794 RepID=K7AAE2_9ALTE|nr:hypothetical protein C427_3922 [Paraglaciecola psychrophila 170]GAC37703.1 hypothetical protein GPSY_2081 [Paraglaciecola psychrophila 170]